MTDKHDPAAESETPAGSGDALRDNPGHIDRVSRADVETILADSLGEKFGDRFFQYRTEYRNSINSDNTGFVADYPMTVGLELVNRCNLTCKMCYTINHSTPKETLGIDDIRGIMEDGQKHGLPAVIVGLGSEPLLYKKIRDVFKLVTNAGVMDVFLGTNGVLLTESMCDFLVTSGVSRVHVSLDAATPETYKIIRGKDELERIESNIASLIAARERHGSTLPIIRVSFCVQEDNIHEKEAFAEKWQDVADYVDFQIMSDFSHVDEIAETGEYGDARIFDPSVLDKPFCEQPFTTLHVWSNGNITPCCTFYAKNLVMGNVKDTTLSEVWKGDKLEALRDEFRCGKINANCEICLAGRGMPNPD